MGAAPRTRPAATLRLRGAVSQYAPFGAPPPLMCLEAVFRAVQIARAQKPRRENGGLCFPPPHAVRGRGTTRSVVEGASDSTLRGRRKRFVEARAPSTALLPSAVPSPTCVGEDEDEPRRENEIAVVAFAQRAGEEKGTGRCKTLDKAAAAVVVSVQSKSATSACRRSSAGIVAGSRRPKPHSVATENSRAYFFAAPSRARAPSRPSV